MKLKIINGIGRFDNNILIKNDKGPIIEIEHDYRFFDLYVHARYNNNIIRHVTEIKDNKFQLDNSMIKAGKIEIEIKVMTNGELVRTLRCEPLMVKEINGGIEAIPEIKYLENIVDNLKMSFSKVLKIVGTTNNISIVISEDGTIKGENE